MDDDFSGKDGNATNKYKTEEWKSIWKPFHRPASPTKGVVLQEKMNSGFGSNLR
jgi:hypothetical protein